MMRLSERRMQWLRKQVLRVLQDCHPATMTTDELADGIPTVGQDAAAAEGLRQVLSELSAWGYIENRRGDQVREAWWRITGDGLAQIGMSAKRLDVRIFGRLALG